MMASDYQVVSFAKQVISMDAELQTLRAENKQLRAINEDLRKKLDNSSAEQHNNWLEVLFSNQNGRIEFLK